MERCWRRDRLSFVFPCLYAFSLLLYIQSGPSRSVPPVVRRAELSVATPPYCLIVCFVLGSHTLSPDGYIRFFFAFPRFLLDGTSWNLTWFSKLYTAVVVLPSFLNVFFFPSAECLHRFCPNIQLKPAFSRSTFFIRVSRPCISLITMFFVSSLLP